MQLLADVDFLLIGSMALNKYRSLGESKLIGKGFDIVNMPYWPKSRFYLKIF